MNAVTVYIFIMWLSVAIPAMREAKQSIVRTIK